MQKVKITFPEKKLVAITVRTNNTAEMAPNATVLDILIGIEK